MTIDTYYSSSQKTYRVMFREFGSTEGRPQTRKENLKELKIRCTSHPRVPTDKIPKNQPCIVPAASYRLVGGFRWVSMDAPGRPQPNERSPRENSEKRIIRPLNKMCSIPKFSPLLPVLNLRAAIEKSQLWIVKSLNQRKQARPRYSQLSISGRLQCLHSELDLSSLSS
jgi:hypothetical protein